MEVSGRGICHCPLSHIIIQFTYVLQHAVLSVAVGKTTYILKEILFQLRHQYIAMQRNPSPFSRQPGQQLLQNRISRILGVLMTLARSPCPEGESIFLECEKNTWVDESPSKCNPSISRVAEDVSTSSAWWIEGGISIPSTSTQVANSLRSIWYELDTPFQSFREARTLQERYWWRIVQFIIASEGPSRILIRHSGFEQASKSPIRVHSRSTTNE